MQTILQNSLITRYPALYKKSNLEFPSGWFTLIDTVSQLISEYSSTTVVENIKTSYGSLSISTSIDDKNDYDYVFGLTSMAYWFSQIICEKCSWTGAMYNSFGQVARCEQHDSGNSHIMEHDETEDLPFELNIKGLMWKLLIVEFYQLVQLHIENNGMPPVKIKSVHKVNGKLNIQLSGGDQVTQGMLALLLAYAGKIDEDTGEIQKH